MDITPVAELRPGRLNYKICVRISRMWEFRGTNEEDNIKHLDLVLIDKQGNPIYAEIPPDAIPSLEEHLYEGNIVYITKITINNAKTSFRAVDNPYMIRLNKRSTIIEAKDQPMDFPKYTFSLVSFDELHHFTNRNDRFLDVIGKIIAVSNAAMKQTTSSDFRMRRVVKLQDLRGTTVELSLSGKRAIEFDGETILEVGQTNHVIAIFVGTSMKIFRQTHEFLSGTAACRWYINENDIPEIKMFQKSLPPYTEPMQRIYLQNDQDMQNKIEQKTLAELKEVDPFVDKDKKYECTVIIIGIKEKKGWCYQACKICSSKMLWNGTILKCRREKCPCTQYDYKYKIAFIANDGTDNIELMLFEKKGTELIGRSAESMKRQYDTDEIPPEIKTFIGHKFTFIVKVLPEITINADEPSFEILTIKERFGKQMLTGNFMSAKSTPMSSSSVQEIQNLPPLVPILTKKPEKQCSSSHVESANDITSMEIEPYNIETTSISNKRNYDDPNKISQEEDLQGADQYSISSKSKRKRTG